MFFRVYTDPACGLDPTSLAIVGSVVSGLTNRQIGVLLGYREQSIKNRLLKIYRATGARNKQHLAYLALARGWVILR